MRMTLMHREHEVLTFDFNAETGSVGSVCPCERADLAPLGVFGGYLQGKAIPPEQALAWHLKWRCIFPLREDLGAILRATGATSPHELAVAAHGFSLSDCFWYRLPGDDTTWAGSNFFDNGWDPAFGRAVLERNYAALARADAFVPDVTCGGISRKAWALEDELPRLLKASLDGEGREAIGEMLASRLLARIMCASDYVRYDLKRTEDEWFSACSPMVVGGESLLNVGLVSPDNVSVAPGTSLAVRSQWVETCRQTFDLLDVADRHVALSKMGVAATLLMRRDMNVRNYGVIRPARSGTLRAAPLFDLAGSFMMSSTVLPLSANNQSFMVPIAQNLLSAVEPTWDYTWYDPGALAGFGEELEEALGGLAGWPCERCAAVRALFEGQLAHVNAMAAGCGS